MDSVQGQGISDYRHFAVACLVLVATGFTIKKAANYYAQKNCSVIQVLPDAQKQYEIIKVKLNRLKEDIEYANKPLHEFEHERLVLLQEIMSDVLLEHKTEQEIHHRLKLKLCPMYTGLALAVGDVNQALLNLKKKRNQEQKEQQDLGVKGYEL